MVTLEILNSPFKFWPSPNGSESKEENFCAEDRVPFSRSACYSFRAINIV